MDSSEKTGFDYFILVVTRKEIEIGDISNIANIFSSLIKEDNEKLRRLKCKYSLSISGYDYDSRELFEIPEFISWTQKLLDEEVPEFMYFFENKITKLLTFAYLCAKKEDLGQVYINPLLLSDFCKDRLREVEWFMKDINYSDDEIEKFNNEVKNSFGLNIIND